MCVYSLVIIGKIAWNVNAIGTRHTIGTGGTRDGGEARHLVGNLGQQGILGLGTVLKRREGCHILFHMLHLIHATQGSKDIRMRTHPAESPTGRTIVGANSFELISKLLCHFAKGTASQWFHYHTLNACFLTFII